MPSPDKDPRPTTNLDDHQAWPFPDGAEEIVIRVSQYGPDCVTPVSYQAVVKHRQRSRAWGVGVRASPVAALHQAISTFYDVRPWPSGGEHGLKREPLVDEAAEQTIEDMDIDDLLS